MREVSIGDKQIRLRATPLALLFYKQEFKADLVGDLMKMQALETDLGAFDSVAFLQIIWALAKADNPKGFPSFPTWLAELEDIDFTDPELLMAVMEEAVDGFFRRGKVQQGRRK